MTYALLLSIIWLIQIIQFLMLARAVVSWFSTSYSGLYGVLCRLTEPFIVPFRKLLGRFEGFSGLPIDIPYMAAFLTLEFIRRMLI